MNSKKSEDSKNTNSIQKINLKINFIGESNCGKTSLIKSILFSKFFEKENETILNIFHTDLETTKDFEISYNIL